MASGIGTPGHGCAGVLAGLGMRSARRRSDWCYGSLLSSVAADAPVGPGPVCCRPGTRPPWLRRGKAGAILKSVGAVGGSFPAPTTRHGTRCVSSGLGTCLAPRTWCVAASIVSANLAAGFQHGKAAA
jgi:hypothetical protein